MAVRHDGDVVVAAYLDSPDNQLTVWEERSGLRQGFVGTGGMNAGVALSLDEDMRYCVTLTDVEDTGSGFLLRWNGQLGDYALMQFATDAEGSMTMSQWRTEYGPFISYLWQNTQVGQGWTTDCLAYIEGIGSDLSVYSFYDDEQVVPVRHSCDPFAPDGGVFAYFPDLAEYHNLWAVAGPGP